MERKLLFGERMLLGNGSSAFNEVIPLRINGHFTEVSLHHALHRLQEKHPWLNAFVKNDKKRHPCFVVDPQHSVKIPVRIVERTNNEERETETVKEWSTVFDTGKGP